MMHAKKPQDIESSSPLVDETIITTGSDSPVSNMSHHDESKNHNGSGKTLRAKVFHVMAMNILPDNIVQSAILQKINLTVSVELFRLTKYVMWTYAMIFSAIPLIRWIVSRCILLEVKQYYCARSLYLII